MIAEIFITSQQRLPEAAEIEMNMRSSHAASNLFVEVRYGNRHVGEKYSHLIDVGIPENDYRTLKAFVERSIYETHPPALRYRIKMYDPVTCLRTSKWYVYKKGEIRPLDSGRRKKSPGIRIGRAKELP